MPTPAPHSLPSVQNSTHKKKNWGTVWALLLLKWANSPKLQNSTHSCRAGSTAPPRCPTCSAGRSFDGPRSVHPDWLCRGNGGCKAQTQRGCIARGWSQKPKLTWSLQPSRGVPREEFHETREHLSENATFDNNSKQTFRKKIIKQKRWKSVNATGSSDYRKLQISRTQKQALGKGAKTYRYALLD